MQSAISRSLPTARLNRLALALPGLVLCGAVATLAVGLEAAEIDVAGKAWLEALVLAILLGTVLRAIWQPGSRWQPGIAFTAKIPLEIAVMLLGASLSAETLRAAGPTLLAGIAVTVALAIVCGVLIGRVLGLSRRMAILIASGNAICGNSAIAAVAPVIDADGEDVAAAIAFTAVLGILVVLGLPVLGWRLGLGPVGFGGLAGLTVYAVPQVIAAAAPFGATAIQAATLVKLVRVLMLGPVCLVLSLLVARKPVAAGTPLRPIAFGQMVPWFILGFLGLMALRSLDLVPTVLLGPIHALTTALTILSMAALGLMADLRSLARSGWRVIATAILSLAVLGLLSMLTLALVGLG
ncbi:putative sulfate exporter family transporter [Aurantimonas sp. MSK8Z-1]|uniref:YeiH family protein n=1 Tax=Mangrovibrevibacter kandeliae TaxID=2968473 RepID=UPI0021192831|nr:putative sulfate exporter family transporter [Aurantimonas sp. MSK8Z-1]MCW4113386.1 putative sulfate exporter family transporter [Aurantimonas sp. MSK8Z-1]